MWRPRASSMVSHAARVGAITITRPVGGSALTNSSRSGGSQCSWTLRITSRAGARRTPGSGVVHAAGARTKLREVQNRRPLLVARSETLDRRIRLCRTVATLRRYIIVAENHAALRRPVAHCGRTIRGGRLLRRRHSIQPDAAHSSRRPLAGGDVLPLSLSTGSRWQSEHSDTYKECDRQLHDASCKAELMPGAADR